MDKYDTRRLGLLLGVCLLAALAGFVWGQHYGYSQGRADTLKAIEHRMNQQPKTDRPA